MLYYYLMVTIYKLFNIKIFKAVVLNSLGVVHEKEH